MSFLSYLAFAILSILITLEFELLSLDGALLAATFAIIILNARGPAWFAIVFTFFALSVIATFAFRRGKSRKTISQSKRGWKNVAANGTISVLAAISGNLPAFVGATAAVAADTVSCEIGELSPSKPRLITTFREVPTGTNGGITVLGELAGASAALIIGSLTYLLILPRPEIVLLATLVGLLGTNFDSLLGAVFENKGQMNNHQVNFATSLFGALLAAFLAPLL